MNSQPVLCKTAAVLVIVFSTLLVSCTTGKSELTSDSPIMEISIEDAQRDDSLPLFSEAARDPVSQGNRYDTVRWGGTIARVQNLPDQITSLEIVSRPLSRAGRPRHIDKTSGRFIALVTDFLDPEIYRAGRDITVVGTLTGRQTGKVGESDYVFPVVNSTRYFFWKKEAVTKPHQLLHWHGYPRHYHDPFWSPWPHRRPPPSKR
ncbi:MAG: Slp family lipoprotein [Granulosicoccus sp.]